MHRSTTEATDRPGPAPANQPFRARSDSRLPGGGGHPAAAPRAGRGSYLERSLRSANNPLAPLDPAADVRPRSPRSGCHAAPHRREPPRTPLPGPVPTHPPRRLYLPDSAAPRTQVVRNPTEEARSAHRPESSRRPAHATPSRRTPESRPFWATKLRMHDRERPIGPKRPFD